MDDRSHGTAGRPVEGPTIGPEEVTDLLRDRNAAPDLLARVAGDPRFRGREEVRIGLVRHPRTPYAVARRFLPHLRWTELAELSGRAGTSPVLRRDAERILLARLPELAVGERITLARRASGALVPALRERGESPVLSALLENPRLTERDASLLAADETTPPPVLARLARHPSWGLRPSVRRALLRNRATPAPAALRLVGALGRRELVRIAADDASAPLVRIAARRRIEAAVRGAPRSPAPPGSVDTAFARSLQSPGFRRR